MVATGRDTAVTVTAVAIAAAAAVTMAVLIGIAFEARRSTIRQWPPERSLALSPRSMASRARFVDPEEEDYEDRDSVSVSLSALDPERVDPGSDSESSSESSSSFAGAAPGSPPVRAITRRARVLRNAGGGDCLFLCFVQAVSLMGRDRPPVTVAELRRAVADSMTEPVLADLRCLYNDAVKARDATVVRDYAFMDGVETLEQLRAAMQTPRYWGDELALPVLERVSGLRVVVVLWTGTRYSVAARLDGKDAPGKPVVFVRLRSQHYELLEFDGQVVFDSASLRPRGAAVGAASSEA